MESITHAPLADGNSTIAAVCRCCSCSMENPGVQPETTQPDSPEGLPTTSPYSHSLPVPLSQETAPSTSTNSTSHDDTLSQNVSGSQESASSNAPENNDTVSTNDKNANFEDELSTLKELPAGVLQIKRINKDTPHC